MAIAGRGYVGVSFFFILSGFVLTWSRRDGDRIGAFYRRRFARIAPVYWTCLAAAVALLVVGTGNPVKPVVTAIPSVFALQAWVPSAQIYFAGNGPGWSISAEAFFYLCFPALVLGLGSRAGRRSLAAAAALLMLAPIALLHPTGSDQTTTAFWAIYVLPTTRIAEFVVGMSIADLVARGWRPPIGLTPALGLAVAAYLVTGIAPAWATVSLITLVPFALVIAAAACSDLDGRRSPFTTRTSRRLGEWSFAFYLVSASALKVQHELAQRVGQGPLLEWSLVVVAFAGTLIASFVLYEYLEKPLERRLRHSPARVTTT